MDEVSFLGRGYLSAGGGGGGEGYLSEGGVIFPKFYMCVCVCVASFTVIVAPIAGYLHVKSTRWEEIMLPKRGVFFFFFRSEVMHSERGVFSVFM